MAAAGTDECTAAAAFGAGFVGGQAMALLAAGVFVLFMWLWFALPRARRVRRWLGRPVPTMPKDRD